MTPSITDDEILSRTEPFGPDEEREARAYVEAKARKGSLEALQFLVREKLAKGPAA